MSVFEMYLELGLKHIADLKGFDHILFLISLMAVYQFKQWVKILKLITAFTIGHSISLALSVLNLVHFSIPLIEFLIPVTICLTALANIINRQKLSAEFYVYEYLVCMIFGLIHGLGFSVLLKSLLGLEASLVQPLLAFNIGIEIGQILIVFCILGLGFIAHQFLKIRKTHWGYSLSGISLLTASFLVYDRWIW